MTTAATTIDATKFDDIAKAASDLRRVPPNLPDYESAVRGFSWDKVSSELGIANRGSMNIAGIALDRHVDAGHGRAVAIRHIDRNGETRDISYTDLAAETARFADVLATLGVEPGQRVFALSGRVPALYAAALGTLRHGAVFCPLFSAFGPEPIHQRLEIGEGRVLVTSQTLYRRKVAGLRERLPNLDFVLLTDDAADEDEAAGVFSLRRLMADASPARPVADTGAEQPALLHFTSGTTGKPKGAVHVHGAALMHAASAYYALDLRAGDIFWCTADPGWVTGTSYGIIAPLVLGATMIVDEREFDAERWYAILQDHRVTVWYTAPTAIRMLMKTGEELPKRFRFDDLRFMASVGEPLNPEGVVWGQRVFGMPFHDNWWQTETGGIVIANYRAETVKPGSMGRPLPGIEAALVERTESGLRFLDEADTEGEIALKSGWPSMFRSYLGEDERYRKCFADGWYLSGDLAKRDADAYFWFVGRADDVIKTAGHLIGPFEVESTLMEHPAVAEVGVIGKPDEIAGDIVKAFVALKQGIEPDEALRRDLMAHARRRLGPAVAPREIDFRENLPKTRSGKIMRRLLRARELGLPEGDLSTLESDEK